MKCWFRPAGLLLLIACAAQPVQAAAPLRYALPPLEGFCTTAKAITTRISSAAPSLTQPSYLGVSVEVQGGRVTVSGVEPDSPAARAGLQVGDVLRRLAGSPVADAAALGDLVRGRAPGARIEIVLERKGRTIPAAATLAAVSRPLRAGERAVLGVSVAPSAEGLRITDIYPGLPAAALGLKVGDVLVKVDGTPVAGDSLGLESRRPGDVVTLTVLRAGKTFEAKTKLALERRGRRGGWRGWDARRTGLFRKPVYRLAVVAVEFPDARHNGKVRSTDWQQALFSKGVYTTTSVTGQKVYGSLNDYYQEQSCGALRVEGKVFEWVEVKGKRASYAESERNRFALLTEALDRLREREGSEFLAGFDGLFFLYAGDRVRTRRGGLYWPHKANVSWRGRRWDYFICPEGGARMASISVIAHEFGHLLGLPDLYARPEMPGSEGLGVWCTMSTGHGNDGKPLHFSAWCKERLGWVSPAVLDPRVKQKLILAPVEGSSRECYKVLLRGDGSEYLLLENRVRRGFDQDLPGQGLLIWRVVDNRPVLEESHGILTPDGPMRFLGSIPYPSASNNAFTPHTTPSSRPRKSDGLPVHITNIRRLPDGRITFFIGYEYL
jgi:M6 family metalloprotease-like protein